MTPQSLAVQLAIVVIGVGIAVFVLPPFGKFEVTSVQG